MRRIAKVGAAVLWGAILWLLIAGVLALQFWPSVPHTRRGWIIFIVVGPPLYALGEMLAEWLWSTRFVRALAKHPSPVPRILVGVVAGATIVLGGLFVSTHVGHL